MRIKKIRRKTVKLLKEILKERTFPFFGRVIDDDYIRNKLLYIPINKLPVKSSYNINYIINRLSAIYDVDFRPKYNENAYFMRSKFTSLDDLIHFIKREKDMQNERL